MTAWEALKDAPRRLGQAAVQGPPNLRSIPSPSRRIETIPFAVLMVGLLIAGMVGLLYLTTQLQSRAFVVRQAQVKANELGYRVSHYEAQVTRLSSPASLGTQASGLGMVPNPHAVFIDLETGLVIGEPTAVTGGEIPSLVALPPAADEPAAEASTAAAPPDPAAGTPLTPGDGVAGPAPEASDPLQGDTGQAGSAPADGAVPDEAAPTAEEAADDAAPAPPEQLLDPAVPAPTEATTDATTEATTAGGNA